MAEASQRSAARELLMRAYGAAYQTALPGVCLPPHLPEAPRDGRLIVLGAGKANAAMAQATEAFYAERGSLGRIEGFVTTRHGFKLPTRTIEVVEAAHPVPDAASAAAAERALALAATAGSSDTVLVLMSGGASALWSAPVAGVSAADKQALTKQLLRSGAPIGDMNTVRRHLSRIKGGRLARAAGGAGAIVTLAISDVPGDVPAAIGSGPTVEDVTTLADARAVLVRYGITPPASIARALDDPANETAKAGDPAFRNAKFEMVARPGAALAAAAAVVSAAGYKPIVLGDSLEGEAREVGRAHARLALEARGRGERIAILSGGEFTVTVVGTGAGGPNQEYAMGLALGLSGAAGVTALAADTDGIDGGGGAATDPAGAIVTPDTLERARFRHMDAERMLANNDSTAFFRALGDLVEVGPTQTNVNDFRLILVDP